MEETVNGQDLFVDPVETTDEVVDESTSQDSPAVEEATEQPATQEDASAEATDSTNTESQIDNDTTQFLAKKGISTNEPLTERERKLVEMYQNAEKGFYQKSQEKAKLERELERTRTEPTSMPSDMQALSEVRQLKTEMKVAQWKADRGITPEQEAKLIEFVTQPLLDANGNAVVNPETGQPLQRGVLINNGALSLDEVLKLVQTSEATTNVDELKTQMRAEIEKELAARRNAKRPTASATDSTAFSKPMSSDDYFAQALTE